MVLDKVSTPEWILGTLQCIWVKGNPLSAHHKNIPSQKYIYIFCVCVCFFLRTGSLTPPVEDASAGAETIECIVEYIFQNVKDWLDEKSFMQAYGDLLFKTIEFQAYQVEL